MDFFGSDDGVVRQARLVDGLGKNPALLEPTPVVELANVFLAEEELRTKQKVSQLGDYCREFMAAVLFGD